MYTRLSWLVVISVHYDTAGLCHLCTAASWRRKLLSGAGCVLPHCFLSPSWPQYQPSFVRKQLLSRHSRRSLEVRNFIRCLIKRAVELWLQPAERGDVGRGVRVCSVQQVMGGSTPATSLPSHVSKAELPKPIPEKPGYVRCAGSPTEN